MRILIQGPMESETDVLFSVLENPEKKKIKCFEFVKGEMEIPVADDETRRGDGDGAKKTVELIMSRTHIGLVYAALATQIGISEFQPDVVIIQGTSGAHNPNLKYGDIVIGDSYVNIDSYVTEKRGIGEGQGEPDYFFHLFEIGSDGNWEEGSWAESPVFPINKKLVEIAKEVGADRDDIFVGTIGSGYCWNRMADKILEIREKVGTDVEEMETFAVAKTCEMYGIPVLPIRVVSNSEFTGEDFDETIARKCQEFSLDVALSIAKRANGCANGDVPF